MTVEELIAEELDKSGSSDLAGLPLEIQMDPKGTYTISGKLPKAPRTREPERDLPSSSE